MREGCRIYPTIYSAFHRFGQAKYAHGVLILSSSQLSAQATSIFDVREENSQK
jgi:hypothetical protein